MKQKEMKNSYTLSLVFGMLYNKLAKHFAVSVSATLLFLAMSFQTQGQQVTSQTFTTTGDNTIVLPAGIGRVTVEAWGGGGGSGGVNGPGSGNRASGGGGGGAYVKRTIAASGSVTFTVGAGGAAGDQSTDGGAGVASTFPKASPSITANGGGFSAFADSSTPQSTGGTGGAAQGSLVLPDVSFKGGDGANAAAGPISGGGGGGAGTGGAGGNASGATKGSGTATGGGDGGQGVTTQLPGNGGSNFGGGASGAAATSNTNIAGAAGAPGRVIVSYTQATSAATYSSPKVKQNGAITITVTFSESVTGTPTITLTGSSSGALFTAQNMSGSGTTWTYTPVTSAAAWAVNQTVTVTVGTATGSVAGLSNVVFPTPATNTFLIDNTKPTASAPTNTAQRLKAAAVSTSTIQSTEDGDIYLVKNSVTISNSFANITTAIAAKDAFLAKSGAVAATPYFVTVPGSGTANDGTYDIVAVDQAGNVSDQVAGWLTIDNTKPTASAPTSGAQTLKAGTTTTSSIQSTEAGDIYLVKNTVTVGNNFATLSAAVTAKDAFVGKSSAAATTAYTFTVPGSGSANDGTYDIVAVDQAGNVSDQVAGWLTIDNTAPTASAPINTAQRLKSGATSTSNIQSTEAGDIYLVKNSVSVSNTFANITTALAAKNAFLGKASASAATPYTITVPAVALINEGTYDIVAVDAVGNVSNQVSGWLTIDNTKPTASAPTSTAQTLKSTATSTSTVESNEAGDIYLVKNSVTVSNTFANITTALAAKDAFLGKSSAAANTAYTITIPAVALINEGTYDIVSVDAAGNVSDQVTGWLTIDNTKPVASAPTNTAQLLRGGIATTSTIQSNEAGDIYLVKNTVTVSNSFATLSTAVTAKNAFIGKTSASAATAYTFTVPGSGVANDGTYDIVSVDAAGNVSDQVTGWLTIDNTIPVATAPISTAQRLKAGAVSTSTIRSNEDGDIYLVRNSVTISNNFANITTAIAAKNAFLAKASATALTSYFVTVPGSGTANDGTYDIVSVDLAGNVSNQTSGWLTIDNTLPIATAPTNTAQILKSGATSTSNVRSNEAGDIYMVKNTVTVTDLASITAAVTAKNAFVAKSSAAANTNYTVTIPAVALINDGTYDIYAVDQATNVSNTLAGWLTVDNTAPTATLAPTATAGPTIDATEYNAGFTVDVAGLSSTGAQLNDVLEILIGGAPFPTPLTHPLSLGEIAGDTYQFTVNCGQMGVDAAGKLITARITDVAGNVGAVSPSLSLTLDTKPTTLPSGLSFSAITTTSATINFTNGNGSKRLVVIRQGSPVNFTPSALTAYTAVSNFALSTPLDGNGNKAIASATATNITNLNSGDTYYFEIFEYNNCAGSESYLTPGLTGSVVIPVASANTLSAGSGSATMSSLTSSFALANAASANFSFTVTEDGVTPAADNAPTVITGMIISRDISNDQTVDWTNVLGGVILTDGTNSLNSSATPASFAISSNAITITGIPAALGTIADNGTKTYQLKVWLKSSISSIDIDNKKLVFTTKGSDIGTATALSSAFVPATSSTSGASNNVVQVLTTKLIFVTAPAGGSAGANFNLDVAAVDANNNVDLDYVQSVKIGIASGPSGGNFSLNPQGVPSNVAQNTVAGRASWVNAQVNKGGTFQFNIQDNAPGTPPNPTTGTTGSIIFGSSSSASTVAENTSFTYPTSIDYKTFRHATSFTLGTPPPADAIKVAEFIIQDGGVTLLDTDAIGTTLTDITLAVTNPGNLALLGISDGTNMVGTATAAASVSFSSLSLLAQDQEAGGSGQKIFGVYASFKNTVTDNVHFEVQITNVLTGSGGSTFAATDGQAGAGGAKSSNVVANNLVVVTADRLAFIQQPAASLFIGNAMSPAPTVEAVDVQGSRDLDVAGVINMSSTGTLSTAPTATLASGFGTYTAVTHSTTAAARTVSTVNALGLTNATSTAFTLNASNASNIITSAFTYPTDILYANFQEAVNIQNTGTSLVVAKFDIQDGGGASDADGVGTQLTSLTLDLGANFGFIRRIALYDGLGVNEITGTEQAVSTQLVTFSGLSITAPDNGSTSFTVRVSFTAAVTDNAFISFLVNNTATAAGTSSTFTAPNAGAAISSTTGSNNKIEVVANHLTFTANIAGVLLGLKDISLQQAVPVVQALDPNNVLDQDYATAMSVSAPAGVLPVSINPVSGIFTFPNNFQYQNIGSGTLTVSAAGLTGTTSNVSSIVSGNATQIVANATALPANISSLFNTQPQASPVFRFDLTDDKTPVAATSDDGFPTLVTSIKFTVNNTFNNIADWSQAIGGAILSDGTNSQVITAPNVNIAATSITFSGINTANLGLIADGTTKTYTLSIWLLNPLLGTLPRTIDGSKFQFEILSSNISTTGNSTTVISGQSSTSGNNNPVAVVATAFKFTQLAYGTTPAVDNAWPSGGSQFSTFSPQLGIEALDANNNVDLGFNSSISAYTVANSLTTSPASLVGQSFVSGQYTLPAAFQYTSGSSQNGAISITAGGVSGTSPGINIINSFESFVKLDPGYIYNVNIPYINYRAGTTNPVDITNGNGSYELARFLLSDGDADGTPGDTDGAATTLTAIRIGIRTTGGVSTMGHIKQIALYNSGVAGAAKLAELTVSGTDITNGYVDFTGLNIVAPDDNLVLGVPTLTPISVRVSFNQSSASIIDKTELRVSVESATLSGGSQFLNTPPNIAGVPGGLRSTPGFNFVNVIASKLDFVTQPGSTAGVNEPVTAGIVHARDQFNILDTDFTNPATVTATSSTVVGSFGFLSGVLNMAGLITYGTPGNGTLTVVSGGLRSDTNLPAATPPNVAVASTNVDVIHVTTVANDGGAGGVPAGPTVNLLAGSSSKVLFGFTFVAPYTAGGNPKLTRFTITFNTSISTILSGYKIFESTNGKYIGSVQLLSPNLPTPPNAQSIVVDFTASPRDLTSLQYSYFLVADISANVNGSTPTLTASIVDAGIGSVLTSGNILTQGNIGSQLSNTVSPSYSFASIAPPTLVSSYPATAQTNVDPSQSTLALTFSVPVYSLDQRVTLWDKATNTPTVLAAANGFPFDAPLGLNAAAPLVFNIPPGTLQPDRDYYVTIVPGDFNRNLGICDVNQNLFPGIAYAGTLFFRTANLTTAPKLLGVSTTPQAGADPSVQISSITSKSAILNASFDKPGTAYYLVTTSSSTTSPTKNQIQNGTYTGTVAYGSFPVNGIVTQSQFGVIQPPAGFNTSTNYFVWMYAETFAEKQIVTLGSPITTSIVQTTVATATPYSSSTDNFVETTGSILGPTLSFSTPASLASPATVKTNSAVISLCSNSYQIVNTPIVIYEGTGLNQQFNAGSNQTFNIVLPAGFSFDISKNPVTGKYKYGAVGLIGPEFVANSQTFSYLSTSVMQIQFSNTAATASNDQIVISGMRIVSNGAGTGNIFRLGGNAITAMNDGFVVASLSAQDAATINFDNSYALSLGKSWSGGGTETAIPDNAQPSLVDLIPYNQNSIGPNAYDFGASIFSGQGINVSQLNLKGVTLDVPFNITITHTDQNGCVSQNPVQFVVYDHTKGVIVTRAGLNNPANVPTNLDQGPYCSPNPDFVINQTIPYTSSVGIKRDVTYDNLTSYYMSDLTAAIPVSSNTLTGKRPIINSIDYSGAWVPIITTPNNFLIKGAQHTISGNDYFDFSFYDKTIVNAHAVDARIPYAYDSTKRTRPANPNYPSPIIYYDGGSLGFVELTGTYKNISNPVVSISRKQIIEFYVPSVPQVEMVTPYSNLRTWGGTNPAKPNNNPNDPGIFVYCQAGGQIVVNGWPKADPVRGDVGKFFIYDAITGGNLIPGGNALSTGYLDNTNGTMTIDPAISAIRNSYNPIRIEYQFQAAGSPCATMGSQVIQISPNPTAAFTLASIASSFVKNSASYCADQTIQFDGTGSVAGTGTTMKTLLWNFSDATNSTSSNPNNISGAPGAVIFPGVAAVPPLIPALPASTADQPLHKYIQSTTYNPTLQVINSNNCPSPIATVNVNVGGIPVVKSALTGVYVGETFQFNSNGSTVNNVIDAFATIDWTFGPGPGQTGTQDLTGTYPTTDPKIKIPFTYTTSGNYVTDMKLTTKLGCVNSLQLTNQANGLTPADDAAKRTIIVLDRYTIPAGAVGAAGTVGYTQRFEPAPNNDPGKWVPWYAGNAASPLTFPAPAISWLQATSAPDYGVVTTPDPTNVVANGVGFFRTKNPSTTGAPGYTYTGQERSALYSPSFDLSNLKTPMISYNSIVQMEASDGIILEFSTDDLNVADPAKQWTVLGTKIGEGISWFTDRGIAAKPGAQVGNDFGWSGFANTKWNTSKHTLDTIAYLQNLVSKVPDNVVFRFALASAKAVPTVEGFAVDNIRIGERTRTVLLESFASTSNTAAAEKNQNTAIQAFQPLGSVGTQVVKINYHMNFPNDDPFNLDDPQDNSSRALFYGIQATPKSILDGSPDSQDRVFTSWGSTTYGIRSLALAQADITITSNVKPGPVSNGKISVSVKVDANFFMPATTVLQIAILEKKVVASALSTSKQALIKSGETNFEYVVKKMLPTAQGTKFGTPMLQGTSRTFPTTGTYDFDLDASKLYLPANDLMIVAFLQREDGDHEVFQVNYIDAFNDPGVVTGLEPLPADRISVFPVPANHEMTVRFPGVLKQQATIQLVDQVGRTTMEVGVPEGHDHKTLNVRELSAGVYIMQIDIGDGNITRKKVMIVHEQ